MKYLYPQYLIKTIVITIAEVITTTIMRSVVTAMVAIVIEIMIVRFDVIKAIYSFIIVNFYRFPGK